jgi:NAD(P)-dependent dehydrogenase (short-subunit alcohol dehydrogenase family)
MVDKTVQTYGKIDILFNNAGILPEASKKQLKDLSEEVWDQVMAVNVKGVFLTSKHVIPEMIKTGGGSIINTSSNVGHIAMKNRSVYVTSKGGVTLLTKAMALDYASYNIRVNCVCPAVVETEMAGAFLKMARKDEKLWGEIMSKIPLGRVGTPEDVAYAVLFLASDESSWITGSSLMVDGGYTAQ